MSIVYKKVDDGPRINPEAAMDKFFKKRQTYEEAMEAMQRLTGEGKLSHAEEAANAAHVMENARLRKERMGGKVGFGGPNAAKEKAKKDKKDKKKKGKSKHKSKSKKKRRHDSSSSDSDSEDEEAETKRHKKSKKEKKEKKGKKKRRKHTSSEDDSGSSDSASADEGTAQEAAAVAVPPPAYTVGASGGNAMVVDAIQKIKDKQTAAAAAVAENA